MSHLPSYPLQQLMEIKKRHFDQAVKTLEEKKQILEKAYETLYDLNEDYNKTLTHKTEKLDQLRKVMDEEPIVAKMEQMKAYLKIVDQQLVEKKKKVIAQQKVVDEAQKQVDIATDHLFQKKKELEKLELHKAEWMKEARLHMERKEEIEHDEQGAATYEIMKRNALARKKKHSSKKNKGMP